MLAIIPAVSIMGYHLRIFFSVSHINQEMAVFPVKIAADPLMISEQISIIYKQGHAIDDRE